MATKAQAAIMQDIFDRLDKVAFHFEERNRFRSEFEKYTGADYLLGGPNSGKVKRLYMRTQSEELSLLYELVHLKENLEAFFRMHQLNRSELAAFENSELYKVAANFVNVHKHGSRGRNSPSAKIDYHVSICIQEGKAPKPSDRLADIHSLVNFEGCIYDSVGLIRDLIQAWTVFLRNYAVIDLAPFTSRIDAVLTQNPAHYSALVPEGVKTDAQRIATERRFTDFEKRSPKSDVRRRSKY